MVEFIRPRGVKTGDGALPNLRAAYVLSGCNPGKGVCPLMIFQRAPPRPINVISYTSFSLFFPQVLRCPFRRPRLLPSRRVCVVTLALLLVSPSRPTRS